MRTSDKLRRILGLLGYHDKMTSHRPTAMHLITVFLCVNSLIYFFRGGRKRNEDGSVEYDKIRILLAAKDFNVMLSAFACSIDFTYFYERINQVISVIDKEFENYFPEFKDKRFHFISGCRKEQVDLQNKILILAFNIGCTLILLPFFVAMYSLIFDPDLLNGEIRNLPHPLMFWYPENCDVIQVYLVVYVMQSLFSSHLIGIVFCVFASMVSSFQTTLIDIHLLCMDIDNIEYISTKYTDDQVYHLVLRDYLNYLIRSHQQIKRNVKLLNRCVSLGVTLGSQVICSQICIFLFCITEVDNKFAKCGYFLVALTEVFLVLIYCHNGQSIIDGNDDLGLSLARISWVDKPQWFKKDLLIMMSMANTSMHIKPYGLYVLCLKNFTNIMNAAYSYFNMLRTIK